MLTSNGLSHTSANRVGSTCFPDKVLQQMQLVKDRAALLLLWSQHQISHLPREASLPHPCHHMADDGLGQISHVQVLGPAQSCPSQQGQLCSSAQMKYGACFLNVATGKGEGLLPHPREVVGMRARASFPCFYHYTADEEGSISYAFLTPSGLGLPVPLSTVNSTLLLRQRKGPVLLRAANWWRIGSGGRGEGRNLFLTPSQISLALPFSHP